MTAAFRRTSTRAFCAATALAFAAGTAALAQSSQPPESAEPDTTSALRLPENPQVFGSTMPSVVKATAIDPDSGLEASVIGPANAPQAAMADAARRKLEYLRKKKP